MLITWTEASALATSDVPTRMTRALQKKSGRDWPSCAARAVHPVSRGDLDSVALAFDAGHDGCHDHRGRAKIGLCFLCAVPPASDAVEFHRDHQPGTDCRGSCYAVHADRVHPYLLGRKRARQ